MNMTCKACGAVCCKVAWCPVNTLESQSFMLQTRKCFSGPGGVFVPSRCRYLMGNNQCSIYACRPDTCQRWAVDGYECRTTREACREGL